MKILSLALCLSAIALGGCSRVGSPSAQFAADSSRIVRMPTTPTGTQGTPGTLILGVQ